MLDLGGALSAQQSSASFRLLKCKKCRETKLGVKRGHNSFCIECNDQIETAKANRRSEQWWASPEGKREQRKRRAEREGRVFRPGVPGRNTPPEKKAEIAQREAEMRAARAERRRLKQEERRKAIAEKPWLDQSLTRAERWKLQYTLDPEYNLKQRLRASLRRRRQGIKLADILRTALNRGGTSPTAEAFLGYSVADLRVHLERQFARGMDWSRFCAGDIHIDHIQPLSSFDLSKVDELRRAWELPNLRPLWAKDNMSKHARRTLLI